MKHNHKIRLTGMLAVTGAAIGTIIALGLTSGNTAFAASHAAEGISADIDAEELWRTTCASCHGRDGKGQTRVGRRSGVEDLTEADYQDSFSDERAFKSIKIGMERNGRELMKPFGEGFSEDNGLSDEEILALVEYTREFGPEEWTRERNEAALDADEEKDKLIEFIREHGPEVWKEKLN